MGTFSESGAQVYRDSQLNTHLNTLADDEATDEGITERAGDILKDSAWVSGLIFENGAEWACDAIAHALATGDWLFVRNQACKHVLPLIDAAAADAEAKFIADGEEGRSYAMHGGEG